VNFIRVLWLGLIFGVLATRPASAQSNEFRALWIDAWGTGFLNASQTTQLIADARANNFNALVVQMRRRGDAFYNTLVPGNDPKTTAIAAGYDALQDVITKAHDTSGGQKRLEVHCWVTTHVIWSGASLPSNPNLVVNLHPEFLTQDSSGEPFLVEGRYLDPGHPGATLWNYIMATNIVRRYDVDGFHWDYIRYPQQDSGFNPTAIARYNAEFGLSGQPAPASAQFSDWRRRQVTDFLRWVNADLLALKPNLVISCAVFGSRSDAFNARFQDWAAWNSEGIIDICMPMGYTASYSLMQSRVDDAFAHQGVRRVYSGQGAYLNTIADTVAQLAYIRSKPLLGSVLYSYRTPNSGTVNIPGSLGYLRTNHQPTWVEVPAIPWKTTPTKGIVRGTVTRQSDGAPVYNATLSINTAPARNQKTEAHGKFAFFETTPGNYTITATATDLGVVTTNVVITAGTNFAIQLGLPPDSTAPLISGVGPSNLTDTSVIIKWLTDENTNTAVDYGPTISYDTTVSNATLLLNHAITLPNLTPATLYHYRVRSRNSTGLQTNSADLTFTSNPPGVVNDVIVESRQPDGSLTANPPYADAGFADSTLKSSASPLTGSTLQGARYAVSGTPNFSVKPSLPVAGGTYDVYLTQGNAASISDDIIVAVTQISCSGLPATTTIFQQPGGNTWEYLGRMNVNAGVSIPTLTFTYSSGTLDTLGNGRMYGDAVKFVFVPPLQPPVITYQPSGRAINQGSNTTFTVGGTGAAPLSYQWRFEGTNLTDATSSSYTRVNAQPIHEGDYSVVITNIAGAVTSQVAFLVVNLPPYIGVQPQNQSVWRGQDVQLLVTAGGTEPFGYQWRFHGTNLPGATENSFTRSNAQPEHSGNYSVLVTNVAGSLLSSNALLTITVPPPPQFQSITVLPDHRAQLQLLGTANLPYAIETSSNLTDWSALMSGTLTNIPSELTDDSASNAPVRFYRARQ
jgi:uncharacterized lipoprotein YddW (UPF0748 family)